jgi:hypothetical protein
MVDLITNTFEYLEDDLNFDYHLKSKKNVAKSVVQYYKDNITIEFSIYHSKQSFNLNYIQEKDESFLITSTLNKLLFYGNDSAEDITKAKQVLLDYMDKKKATKK